MMSLKEQQAGEPSDTATDSSRDFTSELTVISILWVLAALLAGGTLIALNDVLTGLF
ncbi:hypothetical protein SAMN05216226_101362 [Halovenus aranensis]|jgi:hypothetical protein|uniref:Uncharacterized protein n=2 Tax=Halovenus aranensis TaxID=890420 RepID=A0A1G8S9M9_9EURY|nr:hypothetical protein SAMN05216226_101362 [Halovenus aranensis]